jgi:RNA polymerase sigma factor (sigma-70 family)
MPGSIRGSAFRQIQALYGAGSVAGLGDGPLLERFATLPGEAAESAFAALVTRHGPMVWRVCRRVLHDEHDAQDAFQATWLVLVRKAGSLRDRDSVGNWLFGVASRVALDIRAASSRRRLHEGQYAEGRSLMAPAEDRDGHDLGPLLHEELRCLPERYRTPIVLCYLEGLTHEQAALHLGRPVGTVRSRLARGRERLRLGLARRGVVLPAAGLIAILGRDASAAVPPPLVHATIQGATRLALIQSTTTGALFSARAILLSQGALHAMFWNQLKTVGAAIVVLGTLAATGAGFADGGDGGDQPSGSQTARSEEGAGRAPVVRSVSLNVYNPVPGNRKVGWMLPAHAMVKKGELVCELDSADLKDQLTNQKIASEGAKAAYQNAKMLREVAELERMETMTSHGSRPWTEQELRELQRDADDLTRSIHRSASDGSKKWTKEQIRELKAAAADLKRAIDRREWAGRMRLKGYVSKRQLDADDRVLLKSIHAVEQAMKGLGVPGEHAKLVALHQLEVDLEKLRSDEAAKEASWRREATKTLQLQRDIARCRIFAPADGELIGAAGVEKGSSVRERQLILRVVTEAPAEPSR